jgi:hypothetical protein
MFQVFYKNSHLFTFLNILLTCCLLQAQNQTIVPEIEKVYLHTDNSIYFTGDDLFYKAYNVRATTNLLSDNSNILYVELIDSNAKIILRNKINIEIGLGHGDFKLVDSLGVKPGLYQLRAYTNWNRNFGDDFVFKKNIEIIDVLESNYKLKNSQSISLETKNYEKEVVKQDTFKVDFFPEGGSLLENVFSIVGCKAVDTNGKPIAIKGEIYDSNDELVTTFASAHDGMGKCQILPMEGKKYYAKLKSLSGEELKKELPNVLKQGYLVSFREMKGRNIVSISTNQATLVQNPNEQLTLVYKAKGISFLETTHILTTTSLSFELPKDKIPEGISQITLFDSANQPQSERLIYIEKETDLDVQLLTDKTSYQPNEKVTINVSSKSKAGIAKSASFSLSVTDMNGQMEDKDFNSNICSYFLMESDIRGKVHHPAYYFDTKNPNRLEHLDNLLLTQGWRDFVWKAMPKVDIENGYKAEKGITISGSLKQISTDKPLVNNNLTLGLMGNKDTGIFNATTDSVGYFQFEPLLFYGKKLMYLNTRDGKGNFQGKIVLDSIERSPLKISLKKEQLDRQESTAKIVENVFKKYGYLDVKSENILEDVVIKAKKKDRSTFLTGVSQITGEVGFSLPAFSYKAGKEVNISSFTNIFDLIIKKIPNVRSFEKSVSFLNYDSPPLFTLNGDPNRPNVVTYEQIADISPSDVEDIFAVEDMRGGEWNGYDAPHGVIAIWTKPLAGNQFTKNPLSSINKKIDGFYTARVFYSPTPEQAELDNKLAVRNTLYWNPYVHPDKTGNATVNYYNTKVETKVKVALEGITATGIPVVRNVYYNIKK